MSFIDRIDGCYYNVVRFRYAQPIDCLTKYNFHTGLVLKGQRACRDENEITAPPASEPAHEKVGDILRKERITRRIALETIAKDLKLNVKYIGAGVDEHHDLPPDPYIRVYLRTLAKYLMLDPEDYSQEILQDAASMTRNTARAAIRRYPSR